MCSVNDKKRESYNRTISNLEDELSVEKDKLADIEEAKKEVQQIIEEAQCTINNLKDCSFGGDKIMSSVVTSQQGYQERIDYYDEYIIKCRKAIDDIIEEVDKITRLRDRLPINCYVCIECLSNESLKF